MFDNILLVANDLDHSRQAARMVGETARRMGSSSLCIAVAYPSVPDYLGTPYSEEATATRQTRAEAVAQRLLEFQSYYEQIAQPFEWKFTRVQLRELVAKLKAQPSCALAA